jgi:hypothetical protein
MIRYYKYTDAKGLAATLVNDAIRLSRPKNFNDPHDVRVGKIIPDDIDDYLAHMSRATHEIFASDFDQRKLPENSQKEKIILINNTLKALNKEELKKYEKEFYSELPNYNKKNILALLKEQQEKLDETVESLGVFSCCTRYDETLMWAHYADSNRGAVIELCPNLENDSALKLLKPVQYTNEFSAYVKPEKMAHMQIFLSPTEIAHEVLEMLFYSKSKKFEYEQEHRLTIIDYIKKGQEFGLLPLNPNEISAIYFGSNFDSEWLNKIASLAILKFEGIKIYKMEISENDYSLIAKPFTPHL